MSTSSDISPSEPPPLPQPSRLAAIGEAATIGLAVALGAFGAHRFYVGKIGTGILQLLTLGGLGIWVLIDFIIIVTGSFKDSDDLPIKAS